MTMKRVLFTGSGLSTGSFLYQSFGGHDWSTAAEHSFFMFFALLMAWVVDRLQAISTSD